LKFGDITVLFYKSIGIVFTPEAPYSAIYAGLWGYNAILSAGAAGGFFFVMTFHSFLTALMNVIFTVLLQQGLVLAFRDVSTTLALQY